jgi:hypothetical protein
VDVGLYANPVGKAHDEFDVLYNIALFVAGIIVRYLEWRCYVVVTEKPAL